MKVIIKRQDRIDYVISKVAEFYNTTPEVFYKMPRTPESTLRKAFLIYILSDICDIQLKEIHSALHYKPSVNSHGPMTLLQNIREEIYHNEYIRSRYNKLAEFCGVL
jgi:hypothetical protein